MSALLAPDFEFVTTLLYAHSAIVLERGKEYLVEARLTPLAEREGYPSLTAFIGAMRSNVAPAETLQSKAVDALTTNETYFFRDFHPFEALRQTILPGLLSDLGPRRLTIWCAACSTGQEPYSIAMLLREHFPELAPGQIEIIATDLSPTVLRQAAAGRYNQIEINRGLPAAYLVKYFTQEGAAWIVKPEIRQMVQFRQLNLVQPWPVLPACDLIFIRNVMIYFDVETKRRILRKLRDCLLPLGSLFLGSSETTLNLDAYWAAVPEGATVVYRPANAGSSARKP